MDMKNVFSDSSDIISVLVYTKSFLCERDSFLYFTNANLLKNIRICFMPLLEENREEMPFDTGVYKHTKENLVIYTSVEFPDCSGLVCVSQNTPEEKTYDELDKIAEEAILHNKTRSQLFDYIVASDAWCNWHNDYDNVTSFSKIREILRVFLVNRKDFELIENYYCDEFLYYIYRHKVLFSEYQNFWSSTLNNKNTVDIDTASALGDRLLLFSICIDNVRTEVYKIQNNITAMHIKYHISYMLLLITGTFDSLAWIINNLYELGYEKNKRMLIDLMKKEFRKEVEQKSAPLSNILSDSLFISQVEAIRELRDRIVHKNFIRTMSSDEGKEGHDYLWVDQIASDKLLKAGFSKKDYYMRSEDFNLINILSFLDYLQTTTTGIVNRFLKTISAEIYHSCKQYSISEMLHFPSEPYVL